MMHTNGFVSSLDRIATWITRMALLNILWLFYSLAGLFVAGVFPATVAALGIGRKWLTGVEDVNIRETFRQIYRQDFVASNGLGWLLTILGGVLYLNYHALEGFHGKIPFIVPFAFYLVIFFYVLVVIWSFPLIAHYQASIFQQIKNALILGLTKIHISVAIMVSLFATVYLSLEFPAAILFFLFSLVALIWIWFTLRVFVQLDKKSNEIEV